MVINWNICKQQNHSKKLKYIQYQKWHQAQKLMCKRKKKRLFFKRNEQFNNKKQRSLKKKLWYLKKKKVKKKKVRKRQHLKKRWVGIWKKSLNYSKTNWYNLKKRKICKRKTNQAWIHLEEYVGKQKKQNYAGSGRGRLIRWWVFGLWQPTFVIWSRKMSKVSLLIV